ncbi:putative carboxylesterase 2 [Cinnamomum micranthum f. kanehirae]|uniref:Putative carboxylesterase 2 n=1 Tax=Cinnamomum micranthum f. kanehirae TaxID=337451 RepID=A0A3S4PFY5_9MAGN|nr:putative carboxylesterase 2 [Cinnamomum micranthum f. kanehirae]
MASTATDEIAFDFRPYFILYKDGHVDRLTENDFVPPSLNPEGVSSKDVAIIPELGVSARLFLPKLDAGDPHRKLPILVYYHGGGFCFVSAFCSLVHSYLTSIVTEANVIAVSVDFRRFPEHTLPAAYDDCWAALQWVASHSAGGDERWLSEHGDFDRITIIGDSAGGNIVHNVAMRAGREELGHGVKLDGAIFGHPYFCGAEAVGDEVKYPEKKAQGDYIWMLTNPATVGLDDPQINPIAVNGPSLSGLGCARVLLCVAGNDILRDRGLLYYERLRSSGWKGTVELLESEGEEHVFHLYNPTCENARIIMQHIVSFLN